MPKVFVEYDSDVFDIEVDITFDDSVLFDHIFAAMVDQIDPDISVDTHVFEVFSPLTRTYKSIYDYPSIKGSRILANQSVLRVSAKPTEQFKCTVEFFDHLNTKHGYDVVVDNCCNEAVKYQKLMDKFWDHCGKNFPINYTFEIFDEETKQYKKLNKRKPIIPNGCLIRIRPSDELKVKPVEEPPIKPFAPEPDWSKAYKTWSKTTTLHCEKITSKPKKAVQVKKHNEIKRRPNQLLSDWISKEFSDLGIDDTKQDEKEDNQSNDDGSGVSESRSDSPQTFFETQQDRNDYYICLTITHCLKESRKAAIENPLVFFHVVSLKLKHEHQMEKASAEWCRQSFEELFYRYLGVLSTATNLVDAQSRLKCFDMFDSIDLSLFLMPNLYQSVDYLRYKLWYGIEPERNPIYNHRCHSQPFVNTTLHPFIYPFAGHPLYYDNHQNCCVRTSAKSYAWPQHSKQAGDQKTSGKPKTCDKVDEKSSPVKTESTVDFTESHESDIKADKDTEALTVQQLVSLAESFAQDN